MVWLIIAANIVGGVSVTHHSEPANHPRHVEVGIYVNQLRNFSLQDNGFDIDVFVWFRWVPEEFSDAGHGGMPHQTFEIVGATNLMREEIQFEAGYAVVRVRATLSEYWDVRRFPRDNHTVLLRFEDEVSEIDLLVLSPDRDNSGVNPQVQVPGWILGPLTIDQAIRRYDTNFGDTTLSSGAVSEYSSVSFAIPLERRGVGMILKLFGGLFVAVSVALVAFFVDAREVDPRFGLAVGGLFAAVANQYIVAENLPSTGYWTLSDKIHVVGFLTILAVILQSAYALRLHRQAEGDVDALVDAMDRRSALVVGAFWMGSSLALILSVW